MRFLRIPIVEEDAQQMPEWVIHDLERQDREERREAPRERLELPLPEPHRQRSPPEPTPASTIIVIDL